MKKILSCICMMFSVFVSCDKYDDTDIWDAIDQLQERIEALEQKVTDNVTAIQSIVSVGSITAWDYDAETGKGTITLIGGKTLMIDQSVSGYSLITVMEGEDGQYYWAICKDGDSSPLLVDGKKVPVTVTPALKISPENEWMISVDGGQTWISTGILYTATDDSEDKDDVPETEVVFFDKVESDGEFLYLTFTDGTVVKVKIVGEASISSAADTLWFSRADMNKSVALEMVNVKAFTITEKPEGWKASIDEELYLTVTSPDDFESYPTEGTVKILAVFEDGVTPEILYVTVVYEPPFELSFVNGLINVEMSKHTSEDFNGYLIVGWKDSDYSSDSALDWLNTGVYEDNPYEGTAAYKPKDVIDDYSSSEDYVVVAVPYLPASQVLQGNAQYLKSDIQTIKIKGSTDELSVSEIGFDRATFTATFDVAKYYGGFMKLADWNNYGRDNFLETLKVSNPTSYSSPQYSGPANQFPSGEADVKINPATEYVVWYLPFAEDGKYAAEDFIVYTFTTPDVTFNPAIPAPSYEVDEISASGCTVSVTPASDSYKTYAAIVKASAIPESNVEIVRYLIGLNHFSSASAKNTVSNNSLNAADDVHVLAVSVSENGEYGVLVNQTVELESLKYSENLSVEVTDVESGIGEATLSLQFTGNPAEITYFISTFTFFTDEVLQEMLALEQYGDASTAEISKLGGKLIVSDLEMGAVNTFYAVVRDSEGLCSYLYKYEFTPQMQVDYILKSAQNYSYGMPQLSGTKSVNTGIYTLTLDVEMPAECVKYWLFKGDSEYFTGDEYIDSDKLLTMSLYGTTVHDSSEIGLRYDSMNSASRIYMVWLDDKGEYHAIYEYNPNN